MTDLQLGLLAIGIALVVAVLAYNKWQERQYRRKAEASFRTTHEDVLMGGAEGRPAPPAPRKGPLDERIEPVLEEAVAGGPAEPPDTGILSEALDFIIPVEAAEDVRGDAVLSAARAALAACSKPVHWEGYNETAARWETLRAGVAYPRLRAGLQLVDRRGAVSVEELNRFAAGVREVAAGLGALAAGADTGAALDDAADLDRFCSDVDIRIALNLVGADMPFAGTRVQAMAEAAGLSLHPDGKFWRSDESGRTLYALVNAEAAPFRADAMSGLNTRCLVVELDVPRASGGSLTFEQFREFAHELAQGLDAQVVDDNRRPLNAAAFDTIQAQLQAVYGTMEARGIAPGSALALRLFS